MHPPRRVLRRHKPWRVAIEPLARSIARLKKSNHAPTAAPQKDWQADEPARLGRVLQTLERIQKDFDGSQSGGKKVSLADLIVLGECAAVEQAARNAGHTVTVPFTPGRTDASQAETDVNTFDVLEPLGDGFRNYARPRRSTLAGDPSARSCQLVAPHCAGDDGSRRGHACSRCEPRPLAARRSHRAGGDSDEGFLREPARHEYRLETVRDREERVRRAERATGKAKWTVTAADLVFGAHSQLRALAEVYASDDAKKTPAPRGPLLPGRCEHAFQRRTGPPAELRSLNHLGRRSACSITCNLLS